jgi:hypothetical protein
MITSLQKIVPRRPITGEILLPAVEFIMRARLITLAV